MRSFIWVLVARYALLCKFQPLATANENPVGVSVWKCCNGLAARNVCVCVSVLCVLRACLQRDDDGWNNTPTHILLRYPLILFMCVRGGGSVAASEWENVRVHERDCELRHQRAFIFQTLLPSFCCCWENNFIFVRATDFCPFYYWVEFSDDCNRSVVACHTYIYCLLNSGGLSLSLFLNCTPKECEAVIVLFVGTQKLIHWDVCRPILICCVCVWHIWPPAQCKALEVRCTLFVCAATAT